MILRLAWAALFVLPFALTVAALFWLLSFSPLTAPFAERSAESLRLRLDVMMAQEVTPDWLEAEAQVALRQEDIDRLDLLLGLANDRGIVLPEPLLLEIKAFDDARSGFMAQSLSCGRCALDLTTCETIAQLGACGVTFELTPAGDLNAIRRAGTAYVAGDDVDQLDLGLAIVGLGATGAVLVSGGSSYTIKAATGLLRVARRIGTLTPALTRRLTDLVAGAVRWDRMGDLVRLRIGPAEMVDTARMADLTGLGASLTRVISNTSTADAVSLLRYVDGPEDAARLARVSDAMGDGTRPTLEVLGKSRVFRAAVRLTDAALGTLAAIAMLIMQVAGFVGQQLGNRLVRLLRRRVGTAVRAGGRG